MLNTIMKRGICFAALCCVVSNTAHAQFSQNSSAPTDISADNAEYGKGVIILTGQVDVRQAEARVLSDMMKIYTDSDNSAEAVNDFRRVDAIGNFYYITPDQEVRGEKGVYLREQDTFTVTGDVILLQGEDNVVTGDKLVYNLTTNEARVIGTCKGRVCGRKGRVNILIKNTGETNAR